MKSLYYLWIMILFISGCNVSESDSNQTEVKGFDVVEIELRSGEEFVYSLGFLGDEEQATIKEDSKNAEVSKLIREFDESATVEYRYQSKADFSGKDTVVLEVRRGSDGASPNREIYITVLHFNIQTSS